MSQFDALVESERQEHLRALKSLARYMWPKGRGDLRIRVVLAMSCLVLAKVVNVGVPLLLKRAIDSITPSANGGAIAPFAVTLGVIVAYGSARALAQAFGELRDYFFAKVSRHTQRIVALETFRHLHSLSLAFHLGRQTGGLSRVIERGTSGIATLLSFMLFNILPTFLEIALVSIILWTAFGWSFALITFVTIVCYIGYTLSVTDWRVKFRRTMNQRDSEANNKAIDSLLNYETVKYFVNEAHERSRYDRSLEAYETAAVKSQTSLSLLNIGQGVIIALGLIAVMAMSAREVGEGRMTVGDFVLVNTYLIQLYLPLNFLGFVYSQTKQSLVDMDKMFELLNVAQDVRDKESARELEVSGGEIVFEDVGFSYQADREILKGVSFRVPPGRKVAIVGPSGAGKSTISRLLFRFYDVTSGSISIDGQDIRDVKQDSLRRAIGIVPQDTVLFNDTIGYNVQYGNPGATFDEVRGAARSAAIDSFVEKLPLKYETLVGERGLKLSGGEKQRVAIARTILKNPRILLFDEATSALDSHTEREIQKSLKEVSTNRTTLVIAHRLSTVVDSDEILVLKDGEIVERGRHQALLALGGEYASMWARQAEARQVEESAEQA